MYENPIWKPGICKLIYSKNSLAGKKTSATKPNILSLIPGPTWFLSDLQVYAAAPQPK